MHIFDKFSYLATQSLLGKKKQLSQPIIEIKIPCFRNVPSNNNSSSWDLRAMEIWENLTKFRKTGN